MAIERVAQKVIGKDTESLFADMGATWSYLTSDPQLRWSAASSDAELEVLTELDRRIGPEKGVIHLATAAVVNAVWDMFAKARGKPLWKLICDFTPEEFVRCVSFRCARSRSSSHAVAEVGPSYITDAITPEQALEMLKAKEAGKEERLAEVTKNGYPAYTTSIGWVGYSDESEPSSAPASPALMCAIQRSPASLGKPSRKASTTSKSRSAQTSRMTGDGSSSSGPSSTIRRSTRTSGRKWRTCEASRRRSPGRMRGHRVRC